ncbi:MAG: hypothetical protein NUV69_01880 [Candidatus Curtissbacteria bacterium]|nr:hypothetical protein [Candidatus Curtissbacteria bacterium]
MLPESGFLPPFRGRYQTVYGHDIYGADDFPNQLIRKTDYSTFHQLRKDITAYSTVKKCHQELQDQYGISVPNYNLVIGQDPLDQGPSLYVVVQKVNGVSLFTKEHGPSGEEVNDLMCTLIQYYTDKYLNGGDVLSDICSVTAEGRSQFMFGRLNGEERNRFFLVDIDPFVGEGEPRQLCSPVISALLDLPKVLEEASDFYGETNFQKAFSLLREFKALTHDQLQDWIREENSE